jgi:hypothetical protein
VAVVEVGSKGLTPGGTVVLEGVPVPVVSLGSPRDDRNAGTDHGLTEVVVARIIEQFPEAQAQSVYPWDEWFDGSVWELTPGEDFKGQPATFRASAVAQAGRRGGKVRTRKIRDEQGERLYLQFYRD